MRRNYHQLKINTNRVTGFRLGLPDTYKIKNPDGSITGIEARRQIKKTPSQGTQLERIPDPRRSVRIGERIGRDRLGSADRWKNGHVSPRDEDLDTHQLVKKRVIAGCEEQRFSVREKPGGVGSGDEDEASKW